MSIDDTVVVCHILQRLVVDSHGKDGVRLCLVEFREVPKGGLFTGKRSSIGHIIQMEIRRHLTVAANVGWRILNALFRRAGDCRRREPGNIHISHAGGHGKKRGKHAGTVLYNLFSLFLALLEIIDGLTLFVAHRHLRKRTEIGFLLVAHGAVSCLLDLPLSL